MKAIQTTNNQGGKLSSKFHFGNNSYIKYNRNINKTGLLSAFTFLLLALTCLFPISKSEQTTEAVTGTVQSSSLTLNISSSAASVELDVNSNTGTFASSTTDNSATFSVITNNFSGYTLSIAGSDDEGKLYDSTKQNALSSLTSATSETDFSSTSNTSLNGQWGYKPNKFNSVANDNYLPAPTTEASTLDKTAVANTTANNYSISLGLRADYTTTADTYSNSFIITAVPNPIAYVITYDANTTDTVSNMPVAQNSTTSATSITLSDKAPIRDNYDFKGWCTVAPTTSNPDTCSGTTFQPSGAYGIDQTSENVTVLYAMWKKQAPYIQDYSYAQCSAEAMSAPVAVIDKRDNKEYTVRYINGLCTMIDNLNFNMTSGMTLSPDTTNVATSRTITTVGSLTSGNSYDEPRILVSSTSGYGTYYNYAAATAGTITGSSNTTEATEDICPKGWRLPTGNSGQEQTLLTNGLWQTYDTTFKDAFSPVTAGFYSNGLFQYSSPPRGYWWSSTAHSATDRYSLNYNTSNGLYSGGSGYGIRYAGFSVRCVKTKPGVTISFNANDGSGTMNTQKIDAEQSASLTANTFTRTDYVFTGWNTKADGTGTSYSDAALYTAPASEDNKIIVLYAQWATNMLDDVASMQELTTAHCTGSYDGATATLTDTRDNNTYTIAKINGLCTMTQNLNFNMTSGITLSPETTNVTTNRTIATVGSLASGNSYDEPRIATSTTTGYGTYYNYAAATAGTITGSSNSTNATEDICPKGWRLPTGNSTGEQFILNNSYTFQSRNANYPTEFSPVAAGIYNGSSLSYAGTYGFWWSSTAYSTTYRYYLNYDTSDGLTSGSIGNRNLGFSVRCVLK